MPVYCKNKEARREQSPVRKKRICEPQDPARPGTGRTGREAVDIRWEDGFEIFVKARESEAVIRANREGLLSLSEQLRALAEEPSGSHIHLDVHNSLEEGSCDLILEKR